MHCIVLGSTWLNCDFGVSFSSFLCWGLRSTKNIDCLLYVGYLLNFKWGLECVWLTWFKKFGFAGGWFCVGWLLLQFKKSSDESAGNILLLKNAKARVYSGKTSGQLTHIRALFIRVVVIQTEKLRTRWPQESNWVICDRHFNIIRQTVNWNQ